MISSPLFVRSIEKAFRLMNVFDGSERFLSLSEIAERSGLDKSSAQRFTHTLVALGYLERCPATKRVALSKQMLDFSFRYLRSNALVEAATPALVELRRHCEERVNLSLYDGTTLIYAIRQQGRREYFESSLVGRRMPTFCTSGGRAMLSRLPEDEMRAVIARSELTPLTGETITDPKILYEKIAEARSQGYAIVWNESVIGEITVAAPVIDGDGMPIAAVHISGSLSEWQPPEFERRFSPLVVEVANALSRQRARGS